MSTATQSPAIENRYEFVYFFDVQDGNPNGDPDAGNAPRIDPETGQGLVTDVCLKRKVRNFVQITQAEEDGDGRRPRPGYEIYVKERGILANEQRRAYKARALDPDNTPGTVKQARAWMCANFYDVRTFGAVMSTGKAGDEDAEPKPEKAKGGAARPAGAAKPTGTQKLWNCGQVRGPVQLSFSRSIDPILALEHAITRVALTNPGDTKRGVATGEEDAQEATSGQIGRKMTIPYALYRAHGFGGPRPVLVGVGLPVRVRPLGGAGDHVGPRPDRLRTRQRPGQPPGSPPVRSGHVCPEGREEARASLRGL
jgi:CRISPR-associated protein Csd2